jgi:hypothetical protein
MQEVGNLRWNGLFHGVAIHLPNMIADAGPDGTGNTSIRITGSYRPFRERIPRGTIPMRMPPALCRPIIAESKSFHRKSNG